MREADQASGALNEKLLKRQSKLEGLLFDLESVEGRISRSLNSFEEAKADLDLKIEKAQKAISSLADELARRPRGYHKTEQAVQMSDAVHSRAVEASDPQAKVAFQETHTSVSSPILSESEAQAIDPAFEPPSFRASKSPDKVKASSERLVESRWSNVNIYGEPIPQPAPSPVRTQPAARPVPAPRSLAALVEKEVHHPYVSSSRAEDRLQRVYDAAEGMLKAGKDLESVAERTSLPVEEVRMLSQMLIQEQRAAAAPIEHDSRLGVLGNMRREIQTL